MKALVFGEILWDVYPDERFIGGAPLNFAAHLARHGTKVTMLSAVGQDDLGAETLSVVRAMGVDTAAIGQIPEKATGRCLVRLGADGTPSYHLLEDTAWDAISWNEAKADWDLLYFGSLALRSEQNGKTLEKLLEENSFGEVFVDVNIRLPFSTDEAVRFSVENATLLKISEEELPVVLRGLNVEPSEEYGALCASLARRYPNVKVIILTQGAKGACAYDCRRGTLHVHKGEPVAEVSAVGAGDSFSAAFAAGYMAGQELDECLARGAALASFVVSRREAVPRSVPETLYKIDGV